MAINLFDLWGGSTANTVVESPVLHRLNAREEALLSSYESSKQTQDKSHWFEMGELTAAVVASAARISQVLGLTQSPFENFSKTKEDNYIALLPPQACYAKTPREANNQYNNAISGYFDLQNHLENIRNIDLADTNKVQFAFPLLRANLKSENATAGHYVAVLGELDVKTKSLQVSIVDPYGVKRSDIAGDIADKVRHDLANLYAAGIVDAAKVEITSSETKRLQHDGSSCGPISSKICEVFLQSGQSLARFPQVINNVQSFPEGAVNLRKSIFQRMANQLEFNNLRENIAAQDRVEDVSDSIDEGIVHKAKIGYLIQEYGSNLSSQTSLPEVSQSEKRLKNAIDNYNNRNFDAAIIALTELETVNYKLDQVLLYKANILADPTIKIEHSDFAERKQYADKIYSDLVKANPHAEGLLPIYAKSPKLLDSLSDEDRVKVTNTMSNLREQGHAEPHVAKVRFSPETYVPNITETAMGR